MSRQLSTDERQPLLSAPHSHTYNSRESGVMESGKDNLGYETFGDGVFDNEKTLPNEELKPVAPQRSRAAHIIVVLSILMTELCERLTFYSISANMVLFCTSVLDYSDPDAATISLIFSGSVYLIPIVGGYVADSLAGRFNTIFGSGLIYLLGLFLIPASAVDYTAIFGTDDDGGSFDLTVQARRTYFILGLCFVGIGTGGIKANVGPFGAQQVEDMGESAVQSFFNWFYWFINAGAMIAYTAVAYVQQNISFAWGFFIPLVSMILALIIFLSFRSKYINTPPTGSVLTTVFNVCRQSCKKESPYVNGEKKFFDSSRQKYGGTFSDYTVDGIICVLRVVPIFALIIIYWAIYSQMQSTFFLQAERMDVSVGKENIPAAMLNVFNTIIIILLIPLVDRVIYPLFSSFGRPITHLQRMGIGMLLAAASVVVAGIVEIYRKKELEESGGFIQTLADQKFNSSHFSVFIQVPQFALVGASEVFASVSGLEFAFTQAPQSMQGFLTGLFFVASGLGSYVSTAILRIVEASTKSDPWFPEDINNGKVENLFFLLAGLMCLNFIIFVIVSYFYKYRDQSAVEGDEYNIDNDGDDVMKTVTNNEHNLYEPENTKL
ncbi:solute carrier family 15 member 4 [Patella vulgata]|uniref:solute carrier family 15 member 4 n=1 Tax=Patella vulgata TaxID=6465 RepID=UPI0021804074|nr:solute carrier family 15 member 4 [Patella vulgata]